MTEDKSRQDKPQVRVAVLGQTDHGKSTLTAAIMKVQSTRKLAKPVSFNDIDRGASVCDETNTVIVSATQVEYYQDLRLSRAGEHGRHVQGPHALTRFVWSAMAMCRVWADG